MMKFKKFRSIPIFWVFLLMHFAYYITVFVFIEAWIGLQSSAGFLNALVFTFVAALCLLSFFVCVLTDPGRIPSSYVPDVEETTANSDQEPNNIQLRHCDKCRTYKPPRAHHCRVCRRCVLKMDHHCQWINNCVGYWNYKAYFILILHATTGSIYSTVVFIISALQKDWNSSGMVSYKSFYVVCGVIMISLSLTFGSLLGWHIYLITQNMTTIEHYEATRAVWLARKSGQSYRHPYNLSFWPKHAAMVMSYCNKSSERWPELSHVYRFILNSYVAMLLGLSEAEDKWTSVLSKCNKLGNHTWKTEEYSIKNQIGKTMRDQNGKART